MLFDHIIYAGPVALVLVALSVVAMALLLERLWVHVSYPRFNRADFSAVVQLVVQSIRTGEKNNAANNQVVNQATNSVESKLLGQQRSWRAACRLLLRNRAMEEEKRQQLCVHWLEQERRYLNTRLKIIALVGSIAPLLGLLGTVFGIIEMFQDISHSNEPVSPALLADGMWAAMVTTALGLVIAIPALAASQCFEQLAQARLNNIQDALNELELVIAGAILSGEKSTEQDLATNLAATESERSSASVTATEDSNLQPLQVGVA